MAKYSARDYEVMESERGFYMGRGRRFERLAGIAQSHKNESLCDRLLKQAGEAFMCADEYARLLACR